MDIVIFLIIAAGAFFLLGFLLFLLDKVMPRKDIPEDILPDEDDESEDAAAPAETAPAPASSEPPTPV